VRRPFISCRIGICGRSGRIIRATKKASVEDPGGLDHDDCVKRLASRRPPAGKGRKSKVDSAQNCAVLQTGLHASVKGTDICRCDAHARTDAHQCLPCQWFDSISKIHDGLPAGVRVLERAYARVLAPRGGLTTGEQVSWTSLAFGARCDFNHCPR
jgi:hypothetical protein